LGLRFRANEGATVRAKGLNDLRNRSVQDISIAVVDAEAAEAAPVEVEDHDLGANLEAPPGGSDPGALPERRGRGEIDLYQADCDLSGVEAASAAVAGRESQRAIMFEDRFQWRHRSASAQSSGQSFLGRPMCPE